MSKIKGEAEIILKNEKTGKIEYQKKHNLITKIPYGIFSKNPFGALSVSPSVARVFGGIMLFSDRLEESEYNYDLPKMPIGYAGLRALEGDSTTRGSLVTADTTCTENSITFSWEWGTGQANGFIQSIALGSPVACDNNIFGTGHVAMPLGERLVAGGASENIRLKTKEDLNAGDTGIPFFIDVKNNRFYTIALQDDFQTLTFKCYDIGIYNTRLFQNEFHLLDDVYTNEAINGEKSKQVYSADIELDYSLHDTGYYDDYSTASVHFDETEGKVIIFAVVGSGNNIKIIKKITISGIVNGILTVEYDELDLTDIFTANTALGTGLFMHGRDGALDYYHLLIINGLAFVNNYLYIQTTGGKMLKINVTDLTDYRIIDLEHRYIIRPGILTHGIHYTNNSSGTYGATDLYNVIINTYSDEILMIPTAGNIISTCVNRYRSDQATELDDDQQYCNIDDFYMLVYSTVEGTSRANRAMICINPFYLATINNITGFTKTSATTLKINYTLTEVEEIPELEWNDHEDTVTAIFGNPIQKIFTYKNKPEDTEIKFDEIVEQQTDPLVLTNHLVLTDNGDGTGKILIDNTLPVGVYSGEINLYRGNEKLRKLNEINVTIESDT